MSFRLRTWLPEVPNLAGKKAAQDRRHQEERNLQQRRVIFKQMTATFAQDPDVDGRDAEADADALRYVFPHRRHEDRQVEQHQPRRLAPRHPIEDDREDGNIDEEKAVAAGGVLKAPGRDEPDQKVGGEIDSREQPQGGRVLLVMIEDEGQNHNCEDSTQEKEVVEALFKLVHLEL